MPSPHGMDRELRRTIALSRALLRTLGPCSQQPAVTAEETSSALAAIEDGLPFITHPILPPSVALQLHSLAQQSFKDSCRIAIETCGLKNISALQARTVHIKNSWLKMYTQKVEDMVSACSQKMKTQKQIADAILDYAWQQETHPNFREIVKLARLTKRTVKQVTRWFENRRARYKNKPARGPSDMHEVLKNIAAMKKPTLPADIFEDESKPRRHREDQLFMFLKPRAAPRRPLVAHLAPQLWPRSYSPSASARTGVLGPTVIPPSRTDPAQALLEVTKHAMDELVLEMSRLTLRQRMEPRPAKKGKKDPKLALITIEPIPKTPAVMDEPPSKPLRLFARRRRGTAKSKEAAAARQASSSTAASRRPASTTSGLSLGAPSGSSVSATSKGIETNPTPVALDNSSIDFNMLIAQLAADAHAAQLTPSSLNLLPTPDDLSTFFGDLGSAAVFDASHQIALESLLGSDPVFDQLSIDVPETVGSGVSLPLDDASYDPAQHPFDLHALLEFNTSLDAIELFPETPAPINPIPPPVVAGPAVHTSASSNSPSDPELANISNPKVAAALEQVLLLLDDPSVMEQLDEFTPEEQLQLLTEFGMDLVKEELARSSRPKNKAVVDPKSKSSSEIKGKPSTGKGKSSAESNGTAQAGPKAKAKKAKKSEVPAQPSHDANVNLPMAHDDLDGFNAQIPFNPSLAQPVENVDFSQSVWHTPPTMSTIPPAVSADPMFDPVQLVDMPFDPAQFDPVLFAAMQFDPTMLAAASFDPTPLTDFAPADTMQSSMSTPFNAPMPQFDFPQFVPAMQIPTPFTLVPQPTPFSAAVMDSQQTFVSDFTSIGPAPLLYQQVPLPYQQAPLSYQQTPLLYSQASPSYQQVSPYPEVPLSYQPVPLSYQPAPVAYQMDPLSSYQQPQHPTFDQQAYFNFDQQASFNFDYTAPVSTLSQPMPTFIPDLYNPFLTPDWFCAPMATMLQMPLTA